MERGPLTCGAALAIALTSACSLLLLDGDFSHPATAGDASPDASVDAPSDQGSTGDGGVDAAESCATATFCDDFDNSVLGAKWSKSGTVSGALALVEGGVSPPNALRVDLLASDGGANREAFLAKNFTFPKRIRYSMQLVFPTVPSNTDVEVLTFTANQGSVLEYAAFVKAEPSEVLLYEEFKATSSSSRVTNKIHLGDATRNRWLQLAVDVDFVGGKVDVTLEGRNLSHPLTPPTDVPVLKVSIGEPGDSESAPLTVLYDDFWCNLTP